MRLQYFVDERFRAVVIIQEIFGLGALLASRGFVLLSDLKEERFGDSLNIHKKKLSSGQKEGGYEER